MNTLNARKVVVKPEDAQKAFQIIGVLPADMTNLLQAIDGIPSDRLDAERKARFVKFFKGFGREASLDDVKATFISFRSID